MINANKGAIENGHLNIEVEYADPFVSFSDWNKGAGISEFDGNNALTQMKDKLQSNLNGLKDYIEKSVKTSLKESQSVLAESGYFTMHNPIFTTKGDLMVEIDYKGYVGSRMLPFLLSDAR
jgi:hypothetical protein